MAKTSLPMSLSTSSILKLEKLHFKQTAKLATDVVNAAKAAFPAWSRTKPEKRRALFFKAADLLQERADEVTKIQDQETSVDIIFKGFAGGFQIGVSVGMLRECGSRVSTIEGSVPEPDEESNFYSSMEN